MVTSRLSLTYAIKENFMTVRMARQMKITIHKSLLLEFCIFVQQSQKTLKYNKRQKI